MCDLPCEGWFKGVERHRKMLRERQIVEGLRDGREEGRQKVAFPTEKGSWGILLVPFACAAILGGSANWLLALLLVSMTALFLWRGSCEARGWSTWRQRPHLLLLVAATHTGVPLLLRRPRLAWLACGAAILYAIQLWITAHHREGDRKEKRSLTAELVGVTLLTCGAPAAWIVARGSLDGQGVGVWLANLLFFVGGVLYVKYRVRGILAHRAFGHWTERLAFAWPVLGYYLMLIAFLIALIPMRSLPAAVLLAFLPGCLRAVALLFQLGRSFPIRRLGWTEVAHSLVFAVILIVTFRRGI